MSACCRACACVCMCVHARRSVTASAPHLRCASADARERRRGGDGSELLHIPLPEAVLQTVLADLDNMS